MSNLSGLIKSIRNDMREDRGISGDGQRIEQLAWMLFLKIFDDKDKELELLDDKYKSPIPEKFKWSNWAANDEGMTSDKLLNFVDQQLFPALKELPARDARAYMISEVFEGNNNYMKSGINIRKVLNRLNEIDFNKATELLDCIDEINEKNNNQNDKSEITIELINKIIQWDEKNKKLKSLYKFMHDLAEGRKLMFDRNKFIAGLNRVKVKKYGFIE